jgi:hypothetical protein
MMGSDDRATEEISHQRQFHLGINASAEISHQLRAALPAHGRFASLPPPFDHPSPTSRSRLNPGRPAQWTTTRCSSPPIVPAGQATPAVSASHATPLVQDSQAIEPRRLPPPTGPVAHPRHHAQSLVHDGQAVAASADQALAAQAAQVLAALAT